MTQKEQGIATLAVHAGTAPDPTTQACITPIYQTASYAFDNAEQAGNRFGLKEAGYIYSRLTNPTNAVLEEKVSILEGGVAGLAVSSGHAAEFLTFHALMEPGAELVASKKLYGGSINQFGHSYKSFDWHVKWADPDDIQTFDDAITPKTKAIFIESIANPAGEVVDIAAIAKVAKKHKIPLIVDNTMASPYLIKPIEFGANIVIHSATKFLGGHGNSLAGVIVDGGNFEWDERYPFMTADRPEYSGLNIGKNFGKAAFAVACRALGLRDLGPCLSPFNAFLVLTGIETLPLRMKQHCENALKVAQYLEKHPKVAYVNYAGLPSSPNHELAKKYCKNGFGAVFTFGLKDGYEACIELASKLKLFINLANIGDTRSLVIHPASTTHKQLTDEQKIAAGSGPEVIRLSVGIEDAADIIADLEQALK